jgi:hypothetical protein
LDRIERAKMQRADVLEFKRPAGADSPQGNPPTDPSQDDPPAA